MRSKEKFEIHFAVEKTVNKIVEILSENAPSVYMYGSVVSGDFRLGWSDIDILVMTQCEITLEQAEKLVCLRQTLVDTDPYNSYYRSFEGGMMTLDAFIHNNTDRVVYWGTSGEKITDKYLLSSFSMYDLINNGILLYGSDVRTEFLDPSYDELYSDVKKHYETIRNYAQKTGRSLYSFGWMLDISRCIYTLRTGKTITKTKAAEWALKNNLCPDPSVLEFVLRVRSEPLVYRINSETMDRAETLGEPIQRFADVLESELEKSRSKLI